MLTTLSVHAQTPGLTSFSGGETFLGIDGNGDTVGWAFTANSAILVNSLGFYDVTPADNLTFSHDVGLWTSAGILLATATVATNSPLTSGFRYVSILPVALLPGLTYYLGAFYAANNVIADGYVTNANSVTVNPAITFVGSVRDPLGAQSGLNFPSILDGNNGRFGPNFQFVAGPSQVPDSGPTCLLLSFSLLALEILRRAHRLALAPGHS